MICGSFYYLCMYVYALVSKQALTLMEWGGLLSALSKTSNKYYYHSTKIRDMNNVHIYIITQLYIFIAWRFFSPKKESEM